MKRFIFICLIIALTSCSAKKPELSSMPNPILLHQNLEFSCVHENLPILDHDADTLFLYARWLEKKYGEKDFVSIARYYRIAAAYGHYKANHNLQLLISGGAIKSPDPLDESVGLAEQLIKAGVPLGYYDMATYLQQGYGVKEDQEAALKYMRKAADLGNPDAQFYVANLLAPIDVAPKVSEAMMKCAAEQGYATAANLLGVVYQGDKAFSPALNAFQMAVRAGDSGSAFILSNAFEAGNAIDPLYGVGAAPDAVRSARYKTIFKFLTSHDGQSPKVPDIDQIVPLPPTKLPAWDGTFQWEKDRDATPPPEKPSEQLIEQMSKAKHLDPATGLPLSGSFTQTSENVPADTTAERLPLGTSASTGDACPESGMWCAKLQNGQIADNIRRFTKGDRMPALLIHSPRKLALLDRVTGVPQQMSRVSWELVSHETLS